jgi:hypothetical protein
MTGVRRVPPLFLAWVESEAALIKTDGCSKVSGAFRSCCRVHDLAYHHGKDAVSAYRLYLAGEAECWLHATTITRAQADAEFRRCTQANSALGFFSIAALWRWAGVRIGGKGAWDAHRARDAAGV